MAIVVVVILPPRVPSIIGGSRDDAQCLVPKAGTIGAEALGIAVDPGDGAAHLVGHDHMKKSEQKIMEGLEIKILRKLGIENPYN